MRRSAVHRQGLPVVGTSPTDNGMYETRFGLHRKPFQAVLTSDDFFRSKAFEDLSANVIHALRSDMGVAVLTGPSGIGKTVTLDAIRRSMSAENQVMVLRGGTVNTVEDLLHALHRRLLPPPGKRFEETTTRGTEAQATRWEVIERMQKVADFWGPTIVLLDDAHLTRPELFVELRALMEEESDGQRLLRVMIAGALSLEEFLSSAPLRDFSQRIRTHRFLEPFTSAESVAYLDHQIRRVGGETRSIFDAAAIERIVAAADGVPRCIDLLADESLMSAFRTEQNRVSVAAVDDGLSRLRHLPYSWNVSLFSSEEEADESEPSSNGAVTTTAVVSHGVIEVGAPAEESAIVSSEATSVDRFDDSESSGSVIEIGGPPQTRETVEESSATPDDSADRFDQIFKSIAVSGGAVAVAPVPQKSGNEPVAEERVRENTMQDDEGTPFDLEHHMVLPSMHAAEDSVEDELTDSSPAVVRGLEDDVSVLDRYEPWNPAGEWQAPQQHVEREFSSSRQSNASPVFDRYTWCELGRSVAPEPVTRTAVVLADESLSEWPPLVTGIAPVVEIPIESELSVDEEVNDPSRSIDVIEGLLGLKDSEERLTPESSVNRLFTLPIDVKDVTAGGQSAQPDIPVTGDDGGGSAQAFLADREVRVKEEIQTCSIEDALNAGAEDIDSADLQVFVGSRGREASASRVVAAATRQLRMAAGAESLVAPPAEPLQVHAEPAPSSKSEEVEESRTFANLFTRLRHKRRR